jgi:hypothetical protein
MYTKEFMESYAGKIIGITLISDPHNVTYGLLWIKDDGFLISDTDTIACDGYDLAIQEFNRRTYIAPIRYNDIQSMIMVSHKIDQRVLDDIYKTVSSIEETMRKLNFTGPKKPVMDTSKYPHKCPICGKNAYIGFSVSDIECSNQSCKYYK